MVAVTRWVLRGSGFGESFSISGAVEGVDINSQADAQNYVDAAADDDNIGPGLLDMRTLMAPEQHWDTLRVYHYENDNLAASYVASSGVTAPGRTGTGTGRGVLQACCVVTLNTARSGASYRGRLFLPAAGAVLDTDHQFTAADLLNATAGVSGVIRAIARPSGNAQGSNGYASVYSPTKHVVTHITSCRSDSRADIQRSRADDQVPARSHTEPVSQP